MHAREERSQCEALFLLVSAVRITARASATASFWSASPRSASGSRTAELFPPLLGGTEADRGAFFFFFFLASAPSLVGISVRVGVGVKVRVSVGEGVTWVGVEAGVTDAWRF